MSSIDEKEMERGRMHLMNGQIASFVPCGPDGIHVVVARRKETATGPFSSAVSIKVIHNIHQGYDPGGFYLDPHRDAPENGNE